MNSFAHSVFFAAVLLLFCKFGNEAQSFSKRITADQDSPGLVSQAAEEDTTAADDDTATGIELVLFYVNHTRTGARHHTPKCDEHVKEIHVPPPLTQC